MGKGPSNKPTSSLLFLIGCSWYDSCNTLVIFFSFKGGYTLLLWHTYMADNRGFLGWCPHYCSSYSQDVKGLWRWKVREKKTGTPARESRKTLRHTVQVGQKEPFFLLYFIVQGFNAVLDAWRAYHVSWDWWNDSFIIKCRKGGGVRSLLDLNS